MSEAMDWTDHYDQELAIKNANELIDRVILEIFKRKLPIYKNYDRNELAFLLRAPIFTAVNIFIERSLRVSCRVIKEAGVNYPKPAGQWRYFKDTSEAILNYYHDYFINYDLMNDIKVILNDSRIPFEVKETEFPRSQDRLLPKRSFTLRAFVRKMKAYLNDLYVLRTKPKIVAEYSGWARQMFPFKNLLRFDFPGNERKIDNTIRQQIRECCEKVFLAWDKEVLGASTLTQEQNKKLSMVFGNFVDHILPTSIVEGVEARRHFYESLVKGWDIKQVHSFIGYSWNESFRMFSLLAKRQGAALVCHVHGGGEICTQSRLMHNEFQFLDYYLTWAKANSDWMKGEDAIYGRKLDNLKILNLGSVYLSSIGRVAPKSIDPEKMTILYPSSPLWNFVPDLDQKSREKKYQHRLEVLRLLKEIRRVYPNTKIIYKHLWTYINDPIKQGFDLEIENGSVELTNNAPTTLFDKVDIVLWDAISTGFAESVQAGVPTLVFHHQAEYDRALPLGKEMYQALRESGVVFYDVESGLKSFNRAIKDLPGFIGAGKAPIKRYQEARAYPVAKEDFLRQMKMALSGEN